ncbi:putative transcription factor WRKY family [Helianthus debilis subsp. tardiflorus]
MNTEEGERIHVAKPVASRPTISDFRSFYEVIGGGTNGSPSSEPTITAIRPKTVRFKPVMTSPPAQAELNGTQACNLSNKISKSNHTSPLLYKPLAKTVSRTAIGLLANMETFNASHEQALAQNLSSQSETVTRANLSKSTPTKSGNDKRPQVYPNDRDGSSYDGYNWRKYGQKQVKGSEHPRSYYKCSNPNCMVKKKVERSIDGKIAEIVYEGEHNHSKPRVPRRHAFDGTSEDLNRQIPNNELNHDEEVIGSSSRLTNLVKVQETCNHVSSEAFDVPRVHDGLTSKRRKSLSRINETHGEGLQEPRVVVHDGTDSEAISDGFRWRKYGQKIVKGNPYPRSYYRCTGVKCDVRKHVERASDDPSVFITTYEGKHNHEMPIKKPY